MIPTLLWFLLSLGRQPVCFGSCIKTWTIIPAQGRGRPLVTQTFQVMSVVHGGAQGSRKHLVPTYKAEWVKWWTDQQVGNMSINLTWPQHFPPFRGEETPLKRRGWETLVLDSFFFILGSILLGYEFVFWEILSSVLILFWLQYIPSVMLEPNPK